MNQHARTAAERAARSEAAHLAAVVGDGPTVAVVGPGAIGTTVAAALQDAGRTPLLCGRTARSGLRLQKDDRVISVPGPVLTDPAEVEATVDLVVLAVKTTHPAAAAPWLRALCGPDTVVCVLQNGVEQRAAVEAIAPDAVVLPAVVWFPAESRSDGSVHLRGAARLTVPDEPAAQTLVEALTGTWCSVETAADFPSTAWRKLLQNAVAGLMVLTGRRSGMFTRGDVAALGSAYLAECLAVARASGANLDDDVPRQVLEHFTGSPPDLGTSILADRVAGHPLEWDARNGVISRLGRSRGIPTPISDLIVPLLAAASDGPG